MTWQAIKEFIAHWYWIPLTLTYAAIIITIISQNRDPGKSLAYILVLAFLPVAGLLIYYFFGRKPAFKNPLFNKKRKVDRQKMNEFFEQLSPIMQERIETLEEEIGEASAPFRYLYNLQQSLVSQGDKLTLLNNGEAFFPALFDAIEKAKKHIHLEYYIFTSDDVGNRLADLLIQKKKQGLEIRVIVDGVGSNKIKDIPKRLKEAGIFCLKTLPVAFTSLANSNYRNHRKIAVIDGRIGFIGGINIDERYLNNGKHNLFWRDTALRLEGNATNLLQMQFFLSWLFSGGDLAPGKILDYINRDTFVQGRSFSAVASSGPGSETPFIMESLLLAISQAKKNIRITTPYFIPSGQLLTAMQIAAAKGINVELLLPEKGDSSIVQYASFSYIKPLLQRGVKIYLYQKGFIHSKTIFIDGCLAFVGTANMDTRSFYLNFEIMAVVYEEAFCQQCEKSFAADIKQSKAMTLEKWSKRRFWLRAADSVCRLIAPLL